MHGSLLTSPWRVAFCCSCVVALSVIASANVLAQTPAASPSSVQHLKPGEWVVVEKDESGKVLRTMRSPIILIPDGISRHGCLLHLNDDVQQALNSPLGRRSSGYYDQYGTAVSLLRVEFENLQIYTEIAPIRNIEKLEKGQDSSGKKIFYTKGTKLFTRIEIRDSSRAYATSDDCIAQADSPNEGFNHGEFLQLIAGATVWQQDQSYYKDSHIIWGDLQKNPGAYMPVLNAAESASLEKDLTESFNNEHNTGVTADYICPKCGLRTKVLAVPVVHCPSDGSLMVRYVPTTSLVDTKVAKTSDGNPVQGGIAADNARLQKYKDSVADDIVHWVKVDPASIPVNSHAEVKYSVNLVGSPTRVGTVFVYQDANADGTIAIVTPDEVNYKAGQNMVYGKLSIEPHKKGVITIHARVNNQSGQPSEQTVQLKIGSD